MELRKERRREVEEPEKAAPVIAIVVVILAVIGLGFRFLAQDTRAPKSVAVAGKVPAPGRAGRAAPDLPRRPAAARRPVAAEPGLGVGLGRELPLFGGRDIHDVPLGQILDHARRLSFSEARGHTMVLGVNREGQTVRARIWPSAAAGSLESPALRQGRVVARIESNHRYERLGLADGLNYLWVEGQPGGGYRGVIIPATAFIPLFDLGPVSVTEHTPPGVPLAMGAWWVNGSPWIACGRC